MIPDIIQNMTSISSIKLVVNASWLSTLREQTQQPPLRTRLPFYLGTSQVGSIDPLWADQTRANGVDLRDLGLIARESSADSGWQIHGEPSTALQRFGDALCLAGLSPASSTELLAVKDRQSRPFGAVPRNLARLLGIASHSVHLVGSVSGVGTWVQQRSETKADGPGLWDTLMGGTVSYNESARDALKRELWEEAGLEPRQLTTLAYRGSITVTRPCGSPGGFGYQVERIDCYFSQLPEGLEPVNQDGEVQKFALLPAAMLTQWLEAGCFTVEAACVLVQVLKASSGGFFIPRPKN